MPRPTCIAPHKHTTTTGSSALVLHGGRAGGWPGHFTSHTLPALTSLLVRLSFCSLSLPCSCNPRPRSLLYMQPFPTFTWTFVSLHTCLVELRWSRVPPRTSLPVVPPSTRPFHVECAVSCLRTATLLLCYLLPRTCTSSSSRATTCCIAAGQMHRFSRRPSECVGSFHSPPSPFVHAPRSPALIGYAPPHARSVCLVWSAHALFLPRHSYKSDPPPGLQLPIMPPPALFPLFPPTTLFWPVYHFLFT